MKLRTHVRAECLQRINLLELTLGSRLRRAGLLKLDVLPRSSSAATTRDRIQTEADVVDIVDVPEIDGAADDEGPGGFLLRAVVRPIARR